jgi:hypothetical protein
MSTSDEIKKHRPPPPPPADARYGVLVFCNCGVDTPVVACCCLFFLCRVENLSVDAMRSSVAWAYRGVALANRQSSCAKTQGPSRLVTQTAWRSTNSPICVAPLQKIFKPRSAKKMESCIDGLATQDGHWTADKSAYNKGEAQDYK